MRHPACLLGFHARCAEKRRRDRDGLYRSVCRRCGVGMIRDRGSRRWLVMGDRDRRQRTRWVRRILHRLTGPVLFVLLLAFALGLVTYLRGEGGFW